VKTVLKGKRFQDVEDIKKNVTAELNAVPLEAFADCFQKLFGAATSILKWAEITLNRNKTNFYLLVFLIPLTHHSENCIATKITKCCNN
jgi:hypothetical protein